MSRWIEFFENDEKRLSMTRLICFFTLFPSTTLLLHTMSVEALGWYLSIYVGGYVGGKLSDKFGEKKDVQIQPEKPGQYEGYSP